MKPQRTRLTAANKVLRTFWIAVWALLYRTSPAPLHGWRRMLLRCFGARVERGAHPYPSAFVWAPWNLIMRENSCLAKNVDCYNVAVVDLGRNSVVSQYTYLCSASHDYQHPDFPLVAAPIVIGEAAWVAAGAFVGPGVSIGEGAVVGARSTVTRDVPDWTVVAGNPARLIKRRRLGNVRQPEEKPLAYATVDPDPDA